MTMEHIKRSFKVSLGITHPTLDPKDISRALSLSPSQQRKLGQRRVTPKGTLLEGTYQFSSWSHAFDTSGVTELTEFLFSISERLKPHASYFSDLVREGGSVELFCGIFADDNWDENFHHTLLRRLADMAMNLRLDVYLKANES